MSDDANKRLVLARRARFIAAAIAGMSIACGKDRASPFACLEPPPVPEDASSTVAPSVCLTATVTAPTPPPPDASARSSAAPMPCLEVVPPDERPAPNKKDGGK